MKHIASFRPRFFEVFRGYSRQTFSADLMAGLVVGIVALPLAIAFGIASGVSPEKGIITAVVAGFVVSLLGGSRVQIGGPTGAFIVIVYGVVQQYGETGLLVATFMAGVLLVAMGLFKLGAVIRFIPYPVVVGFTAGIALTIFTTQIADLFGMNFGGEPVPGDFIGKWMLYFRHFGSVNWANLAVGLGSILLIVLTPRFSRRIPGSLVAIVVLINGLVGMGYLLGARVEMLENENPLTNLMAGIIKLHVYMTPPSPAQEIDFVLEYDASYVTSALQG